MSVEQILKELPKLTPEERRRFSNKLAELETQYAYRPTPEESAAIDEAIRSLEAGKGIPAAEMRQRFAANGPGDLRPRRSVTLTRLWRISHK